MDLNNVEFTWIKNKPENWKTQRVKNHFTLTKNRTETPQGYPILSLTMKGIIERDISSNEGQLPETYNGYNLLEKDDIVFNPMDLISGWVDCSPFEGLISPSYKVLRPISEKVNIKFYTYYFQTHYKEKIFFPFGEGVHYEYRWGLGTETLKNFPIIVPPLTEQRQIVSFLDTKISLIDSLIEKTQQKIELLKEKRTSIINEVVTKGLNPNMEMKDTGVEWIGEIPSHWECSKVKYFVNFDSGFSFKSDDYCDEGIPLIRIGSLYNNVLSIDRSPVFLPKEFQIDYNQFIVEKDDILISMTGTLGKRDYGYSILYKEDFPSFLNQRVGRIRISSNKIILQYMMYCLLSEPFLLQLFSKPTGTKQGNFSSEDIIGNYFGCPHTKEQQQIVEYLDEQTGLIDKTISIEEKRIELLKEYRQSLISEVVTGKRKVV